MMRIAQIHVRIAYLFFYTLLKSVLEYVEYKEVPLSEVTIEVQSTKIPRGTGRLTITKDNKYGSKNMSYYCKKYGYDMPC